MLEETTRPAPALVATLVIDRDELQSAMLMVSSLRAFGGPFSRCPAWVAHPDTFDVSATPLAAMNVRLLPLRLAAPLHRYPFAYKPYAAAQVAQISAAAAQPPETLLWLDYSAVVLGPLTHFALAPGFDAALRPVFYRNVGLYAGDPPDAYWSAIYRAVGLTSDSSTAAGPHTVRSSDDDYTLKPYFNCAGYALRLPSDQPTRWWRTFQTLVRDADFQKTACADNQHRTYLHQAVFSAVILKQIAWERIHHLPEGYGGTASEETDYCFSYDGLPDADALPCLRARPREKEWLRKHVQLIYEELLPLYHD